MTPWIISIAICFAALLQALFHYGRKRQYSDICLGYENTGKTLKDANEHIEMIYMVAHAHKKDTSCFKVHNNWRKKAVEWLKIYKEIGMC